MPQPSPPNTTTPGSAPGSDPIPAGAAVITGVGLVTGLGLDVESTWAGVCEGRSAAGPMSVLEQADPPREGVQAPELTADQSPGEAREVRYLRHTIRAALADAGIVINPQGEAELPYPAMRCGIVLGTTLHGMRAAGEHFRQNDPAPLRRFQGAAVIERAAAGLGLQGPAVTTCAACSSGLSSIGLAQTLLHAGELDLVIAGGYDTISEYAWGGFNALRLVAPGPVRPFCIGRQGMKLGEGYGILLMERADDAVHRDAPHAWPVLGVGETADAHHLTQPHPEGDGAARAIHAALDQAKLKPDAIGMIGAHATGTPDNERGEAAALTRVFGDALPDTPIVAMKSHLGHTLGGAGAVELILTLRALDRQQVPPTANLDPDDLEYPDLSLVTKKPRPAELSAAMNLSIGFGGANTCVVVGSERLKSKAQSRKAANQPTARKTFPPISHPPSDISHQPVITGVGCVLPGLLGAQALADHLASDPAPLTAAPPPIDPDQIAGLLQTRRVRRMSDYVKLSLAATRLAWDDARLQGDHAADPRTGAILGTAHGSAQYSADYYRQIVDEGIDWANPMLFAEGVPNAGAAHLSLMLGLKGPCQTIIGSRTAGLDALRLAALRIATGQWDRAVVSTAEEATPLIRAAYRHCGLHAPDDDGSSTREGGASGGTSGGGGFVMGQGAATLVLESRASAEARGASIKATLHHAGATVADPPGYKHTTRAVARLLQALPDLPGTLVSSASATWMGQAELAGWREATGDGGGGASGGSASGGSVTSLYGPLAETFSVTPITAIAAAAHARRLPGISQTPTRFTVLSTDPHGPIAAAIVGLA